jgi:hypothetical protein
MYRRPAAAVSIARALPSFSARPGRARPRSESNRSNRDCRATYVAERGMA